MRRYGLPIFIFLLGLFSFSFRPLLSSAQTPTDAPSSSEQDVRNKIAELEGKINDLKGQETTLSQQIATMDNQARLTEIKMTATAQEITSLTVDIGIATTKVSKLEGSLDSITKVILDRIKKHYEADTPKDLTVLLSSHGVSDYLSKSAYLKIMEQHDQKLLIETQQAKNDYANQKKLFEAQQEKMKLLKTQLEEYSNQLAAEKVAKQTLLTQTQGSEANYQRLLAQAKAQLAGFSRFTASQGIGLLSNQTTCDDWGCYYNQRDSAWGGMSLNGTQYTIASDGCLVTSMAMMMTHYGHKTTPVDINSNSSNFASYYPAYLLYTISANGVTAQRISSTIDSALSSGDPVVVGIRAYGGTHFVVLRSGSGGNYMMNDPYIANGNNISFNDHYSVGSIFEIDKVVIQ